MNPAEKPEPTILSAPEYILDNFEHTDRIAVLVRNREFGATIQRITSAHAVEDGVNAFEKLLAQLTDIPTPAGPTPRQLQSGLVQIKPTEERRA
jgi:hypothetical protein